MNRRDISADDLVLYALRLLDESERYSVEQFLYTSPDLRAELALIRGDLATYALATEQQTPPAMARQRLLKQVAREKKAAPAGAEPTIAERVGERPGTERSSGQYLQERMERPSAERPVERTSQERPSAERPSFERPSMEKPTERSGERSHFQQYTGSPDHSEEVSHNARPFGGPSFGTPARTDDQTYNGPTFGGPSFSSRDSQYGEADEPQRKSVGALAFPWFGWAVAAGVAVFALVLHQDRDRLAQKLETASSVLATANESTERAQLVLDTMNSPASQRFVLTKTDVKPPAIGRVIYLADRGSLIFQGSNLDAVPAGKTYELWLIPTGEGRKPVPAGTFRPDGQGFASIILPEMPKGLTASKFGVTVEDGGGADSPTLPIVMIGE